MFLVAVFCFWMRVLGIGGPSRLLSWRRRDIKRFFPPPPPTSPLPFSCALPSRTRTRFSTVRRNARAPTGGFTRSCVAVVGVIRRRAWRWRRGRYPSPGPHIIIIYIFSIFFSLVQSSRERLLLLFLGVDVFPRTRPRSVVSCYDHPCPSIACHQAITLQPSCCA